MVEVYIEIEDEFGEDVESEFVDVPADIGLGAMMDRLVDVLAMGEKCIHAKVQDQYNQTDLCKVFSYQLNGKRRSIIKAQRSRERTLWLMPLVGKRSRFRITGEICRSLLTISEKTEPTEIWESKVGHWGRGNDKDEAPVNPLILYFLDFVVFSLGSISIPSLLVV